MKRIGLAAVFAVFAGGALAGDARVEQRLEFQDTEQAGFVMDEFLAVLAAHSTAQAPAKPPARPAPPEPQETRP